MKADYRKASFWFQEVNRILDESIEPLEFAIDCDTQSLKRSRGGMDPPLFTPADYAFDCLGQFASRGDRLAVFSPVDDRASDASREAFFAKFKDDPGNLYFGKTTEQISGCVAAALRVHAHVERRVVPETEAARGRVQLP